MTRRLPAIAIVGASVRAAAQSAVRGGMRVHAFDLFGDADLRDQVESWTSTENPTWQARFAQAADHRPVCVLGWMYTGALENRPRQIRSLADRLPLFGNAAAVVRRVRRIAQLEPVVRRAGFALPETRLELASSQWATGNWLWKPFRSASGLGIVAGGHGSVQEPMLPSRHSKRGYYQSLVEGVPVSISYLADPRRLTGSTAAEACRVLGINLQESGCRFVPQQPYLYRGSLGPLRAEQFGSLYPDLAKKSLRDMQRLGNCLAQEFDLRGLFGVDLVVSPHQWYVLEVNPRYSASMELWELAGGSSLVRGHFEACRQQMATLTEPLWDGQIHGKRIVYASRDGQVALPTDAPAILSTRDGQGQILLADRPFGRVSVRRGQPILTVLTQGNSIPQVRQRLGEGEQYVLENVLSG